MFSEENYKKLDNQLSKAKEVENKYKDQNIVLPDEAYWSKENYEERQQKVIWQTMETLRIRVIITR